MSKKKILVVDDEINIRSLLKRMLGEDYLVIEAENGREAINISRAENPDLILMDIMMPDVDGYTACSAVKTYPATSRIPVVMLTAVGFELNRALAARVGADGYMTKPFSSDELKQTIAPFLK